MMILDKAKYTSLLTTNILISLFAIIITFSACSGGNGGGDGDRDGDGGDLVAPTITTGSLPGGAIGIAYNQTLAATGVVPITWSIDSGTLPNGLTLDENGIISGIPNTAGASNFTVKATNNEGSNTKALSLIITLTPVAPIITIDSLPNGTIGTIYNQTLTVTGTAPIIWSIDSGTLPDGLTLAENGTISGTPNTTSTSNFTVKATNIAGSNTKALSLIIILAPVAPIITTDSLPNGTVGTTYNQTLTVTGAAPITWSIDSGTLPDGLTLAENGIISGTPSTVGTSNFTVKATNIAGSTTKSLTITISIDLETSTTGLYLGTPDTIDETQTPKVSGNDIDAAITYVNDNAGTGEYSLLVGEDITVAPNTIRGLNQTNAKLTIIGIGEMRKISMNTSSQGRIFTVGASGKTGISLTLGNNITLVGRNDNNEPVVYVQNGAKLTMKSNAIIRGNTTSGDSSGVYVYGNGSSFTMNDNSSVSGNTAFTFSGGSCSGGVYVYGNGSSFTMNGNSSVSDNTAFSYIINGSGVIVGGGVYVGGVYIYGNGSSFTMNDNASISNNGRGVYVDNSGTFSMNGNSSVSNNDGSGVYAGVYVGVYVDNSGTFSMNDNSSVSNNNGGGVYADNSGTFSMNDNSSVSNNGGTYSRYGGGVYVSDSSFTMNGSSSISNNTSSVYGGGVYVSDSSFTMNGSSSISGNTANSGGGGVYVNSGTFLMNNSSSISGNTANSNGGGMYVSGSGNFFTMNDNSSVSGNTANSGGGVHVSSGIFLMNNSSSISGNTANSNGGGMYVSGSGNFFTMNGNSSVSDNTANSGGGVYVTGTFTMNDNASISGNTANSGGGLFVSGSGNFFTMNGNSSVSGNTANSGGGVHVSSGIFLMNNSSSISGNTASITGSGAMYTYGGGGVHVGSAGNAGASSFIMNDNTSVSGNTASVSGGDDGAFNGGGGVYLHSGNFTMNDSASVSSNTSAISDGGASYSGGGGVYVYTAGIVTFAMNDSASVSGNTTNGNGGGMYTSGYFKISGGIVYGSDGGMLSNKSTGDSNASAALYKRSGTAQYGTDSTTWTAIPLTGSYNREDTIKVVNGVLQ